MNNSKHTDAIVASNSEILFLYDARLTNPNGDMDNENKPRMDYDTSTNLVSDVRLKRYVRDYLETNLEEQIFVTHKAKDAKDRGKQLKENKQEHKDLMDCRLFGAVFAETGGSNHLTGPVQFNWGYSLNPVQLNESTTITSSFSSGEGVGKDFRVTYSFIAFSGGINANTAAGSGLTLADLQVLDKAMVKALPACRTRSKIGQTPRLYLRVQLKNKNIVLKDLREYLQLDYNVDTPDTARAIRDVALDITALTSYLKTKKEHIGKILLWLDDGLEVKGLDTLKHLFGEVVEDFDPDA
ncbi:MAG: type I-B CRISPR-associated protein Cas7/Csh2 [bacterium]|nr:type I-B CRISPR-associated protein Cas7/Csh2 [bacterium]